MVIAGSERATRRRSVRRQRGSSPFPFGPELRQARQRLGLGLDGVQDRTGVRAFYLEALEEGDLTRLPDEKTALIAVRRYAEILGLDAAPMTQIVGERWHTVGATRTPELVGATRATPRDAGDSAVVPAVGGHLSRYPGDTSHLRAFTQTAQVPQVTATTSTVRPSLPPGLRFDSTDSLPVTRRRPDPYPVPMALRVAVWTTVVLLVLSGAAIGVHHWRPAWLAKIHLVAGAGATHPAPGPPAVRPHGPVVTETASGPLAATVTVRSPVYQVVVATQAPCWLHVSSPASFAPLFSSTVPAGTTKTFTSGNGQLSVELGASHVTVTVQVLGKTIPGWVLKPTSAPLVVNFRSAPT
ncbi:MAG TPA: helix-turn-helix domain-containing protein [Acidimicrobiales bacterium]|nr:helix-turn-helix domain-containing protein [Acidimicrobiales bacterium]